MNKLHTSTMIHYTVLEHYAESKVATAGNWRALNARLRLSPGRASATRISGARWRSWRAFPKSAPVLVQPLRAGRRPRLLAVALAIVLAALGFSLAQSANAQAKTYYTVIKNELSQKYITTDWGLGTGAPAFQWYNADWPESQWFLDPAKDGPVPSGGGHFRIRSRWNGLCLDLENNSTAYNTRVVQMPCDGTLSQAWRYNTEQDAGSRFYRHIRNEYSKLVMTVRNVSTEAGAEIIMWGRHGDTNQRFNIEGRSEAL